MSDKVINKTILIIDPDKENYHYLRNELLKKYKKVLYAQNSMDGVNTCIREVVDLVILELNLPDKDGMNVIEYIRSFNNRIAIIVLSKRTLVEDKILAIDAGANDYMTKPYSIYELIARVKKEFRYYTDEEEHLLTNGPLTIDYIGKNVSINGKEIHLTNFEYKILYYLASHIGKTISYQELIDYVWGKDGQDTNALRVFVAGLRKKISSSNNSKKLIQTCVGMGYRMNLIK